MARYDKLLDKLLSNTFLGCGWTSKLCSVEAFGLAILFRNLAVLAYGWVLIKELGMTSFGCGRNWVWLSTFAECVILFYGSECV